MRKIVKELSYPLYIRILAMVAVALVVACEGEARVPQNPNMPENWGQYKVLADHPNYLALRTSQVATLKDMIHSYIDDGWQVHIATAYTGTYDISYIVEFRRCSVEG